MAEDINQNNKIENYILRITFKSPRNQWVKFSILGVTPAARCSILLQPCLNLIIGPWDIWMKFRVLNFTDNFSDWWLGYLLWTCLRWMSLDLIDDKSTLIKAMAWCRQATSHYLSQCWPSSISLNGVTGLQWVSPTLASHRPPQTICLPSVSWGRREPCVVSTSRSWLPFGKAK